MGTLVELGRFTQYHAEVQISGDFVDSRYYARGGYDYYDFEVDTTRAGMPASFGGFSGGRTMESVSLFDSADRQG
jgi:hypothetical protein